MKKTLLINFLILISVCVFAQKSDKIFVAEHDKYITNNDPMILRFGFKAGDKVIINIETNKNRTINRLSFIGSSIIESLRFGSEVKKSDFSLNNFKPEHPIELTIKETGFIEFRMVGPALGRQVNIKIERIPANSDGKFFLTSFEFEKGVDSKMIEYEVDSVIGYKENIEKVSFKINKDVTYEAVPLIEKKMVIKGLKKDQLRFSKPEPTISTPEKEQKLIGFQMIISSATANTKVWSYIKAGVGVTTAFINPALAIATTTYTDAIGPQEGGEPVFFAIFPDEESLNTFIGGHDRSLQVIQQGLVTSYNQSLQLRDNYYIGFHNYNIGVDLEVVVAVYAMYETIYFEEILVDKKTIIPETVKVRRTHNALNSFQKIVHQ